MLPMITSGEFSGTQFYFHYYYFYYVLLLLLMVITYYLFLLKINLCQNHSNLFPNNMIFLTNVPVPSISIDIVVLHYYHHHRDHTSHNATISHVSTDCTYYNLLNLLLRNLLINIATALGLFM